MKSLSDDDIDALLLFLFSGATPAARQPPILEKPRTINELSHEDLLRIRSRNHPDKWPNVNLEAYQAAVEELDRRRHKSEKSKT